MHTTPDDEILAAVLQTYSEKTGIEPQRRVSPLNNQSFHNLVREDLAAMKKRVNLQLHPSIWDALLVQSIHGHAIEGHCKFREAGQSFPQATIEDIVIAAGLDLPAIRSERQKLVDQVYTWANHALENKNMTRLVLDGEPLLGALFLRDYVVEPKEVLKGMVLAGFMDNYDTRQKTVQHYKKTFNGRDLEIGGGETHLVNSKQLLMFLGSPKALAEAEHDLEALDYLRRMDVIVDKRGTGVTGTYIRRKIGPGTSDDMAFVTIGKRHGVGAMLGAFVVDAIDTYDKLVQYPIVGGLDEQLGAHIQQSWKSMYGKPLMTEGEIMEVIYFAAKDNTPKLGVSSSHRRFVEIPEGTERNSKATVELHIKYVLGQSLPKFRIGYEQIASEAFYDNANSRLRHLGKSNAA